MANYLLNELEGKNLMAKAFSQLQAAAAEQLPFVEQRHQQRLIIVGRAACNYPPALEIIRAALLAAKLNRDERALVADLLASWQ